MSGQMRAAMLCLLLLGCTQEAPPDDSLATYFDNTGRDDVLAGGNNPTIKVLLLHGGPGATHEYLEAFDSYLPAAGIEYYYYDQLGSAYNEYAKNVLMPEMEPAALAEIQALEQAEDYENPRYMELLVPTHYEKHVLRMPADQWPDPVNRAFEALNYGLYLRMQGPSELGASGKLERWDRTADLKTINLPTLVIGARYDTMDPKHMAFYDDQATHFKGLIEFLRKVDSAL